MDTYIALFRGINVGGRNSLLMKQLVAVFEELKAEHVKTYIQSGNVVFRYRATDVTDLVRKIGAEIQNRFGFEPYILVLTLNELEAAIRNNPFTEAASSPDALHLGFMASIPQSPDVAKLEHLKQAREAFQLIGKVFYLYAPDGIGRSKLAASRERLLGVPMTDRNWNTVRKLKEMATT
jgi:uncharacterized protein (DUF1697 family)